MSVVTIKVNGRDYQIACDDGQEEDLRLLADDVDERVRSLTMRMGSNPGEFMALLLTSLTMADELIENKKEIDKYAAELRRLQSLLSSTPRSAAGDAKGDARMEQMEAAMTMTLEDIAQRIEKIADQIEIR
jgi:cell division protein ZapA